MLLYVPGCYEATKYTGKQDRVSQNVLYLFRAQATILDRLRLRVDLAILGVSTPNALSLGSLPKRFAALHLAAARDQALRLRYNSYKYSRQDIKEGWCRQIGG